MNCSSSTGVGKEGGEYRAV